LSGFVARLRGRRLDLARGHVHHAVSARMQVLYDGHVAVPPAQLRAWGLPAGTPTHECLAQAWRRLGWGMVKQLGGAWCAALLDEATGELLLMHDALGVQDLFHAWQGDALLVASSLEGLLLADPRREVDDDYLSETLADIDDHDGKTAWRHIRRLEQGLGACGRDGRLVAVRTYTPDRRAGTAALPDQDLAEALREQMVEAVRTCLPAEGKVWCELSGGLDSSSVLAISTGMLGAAVETFSVIYDRSSASDERRWMDEMLRAWPVPTHRLDADTVAPFSTLPTRFLPEPTGHALVCAFDDERARRLAEAGVDVVLTGMCGDAVFLGDSPQPAYLADLRNPARLWRDLGLWARESPEQRPWTYWLLLHVLRPRLGHPSAQQARQTPPPWLAPRHVRSQSGAPRRTAAGPGLGHGDGWYWQRLLKAARLARGGQQHLGAAGLFRNPWLHLPLVEFMASVPWSSKLQPGLDRPLQRQAMQGLLPEPVRTRTDKGTPTQALLNGLHEADRWADWLTRDARLVQRGDVEPVAWQHAVHLARHGICTNPGSFLQACMLEAWWRCLPLAPAARDDAWRPALPEPAAPALEAA